MIERFNWTKEADERLKELRAEGKSFSVIANEFGVSRNSVAGRSDRLGLGAMGRNNPKKLKNLFLPQKVETIILEPPKKKVAYSVSDLTNDQCKWPIGEVGKRGFHFCSDIREEGKPYCEKHTNIAYVKARTGVTKLWRK